MKSPNQPVLVVFEFDGDLQNYEHIWKILEDSGFTTQKSLVHAAAEDNGRVVMFDIWPDYEAGEEFRLRVLPTVQQLGVNLWWRTYPIKRLASMALDISLINSAVSRT